MSVMSIDEIRGGYCGVLATIFCSILVLDGEGRLIFCNSAARTMFQRLNIDVDRALEAQAAVSLVYVGVH